VNAPLLGLALASGAAALLYETVWLRWFRLLFGNTAYAASATLCAFFAGLALGALVFGRLAGRTRRPLRLYAGIELGAALAALAVPWLVSVYDPLYASLYAELGESRRAFLAVKFALAFAACLPAATLLGGTFPVLGAAFVGAGGRMGSRGASLYAVNTLGAALGSAAGALWLPERIGVRATYAVALCLSLAVALAASGLDRRAPPAPPARPADVGAAARAPRALLAIAFGSGLGTLAFEVLLIHAIALRLVSSVYSFGAVLIAVLLALALAAALAGAAARRFPVSALLPWVLAAEALGLLALPAIAVEAGAAGEAAPGSFANGLWLAVALGGPLLVVGGLVLPFTFRLAEGGPVGPRLGGLLAANTLGAIAGSLLAGFVLLDRVGLWPSFALLALVYASMCGIVGDRPGRRALPLALAALGGAAVLAGPASPLGLPLAQLGPNERLLEVAEGAHGVVAVTELLTPGLEVDRRLKIDNHYTLSGSLASDHQRRMGHLPLLLHGDPRRVAYVGSATGETASAALSHPVAEIALVEIVPEVQELASRHFAEANRGVYADPRARVVVEDGRNHLRATRERYDVIVADLFVPWLPGAGSLYSLEHFRAVRERLSPGGVFCQWLPIYQLRGVELRIVARTFLQVFPEATLWRGDAFARLPTAALCGFVPGREAPSRARLEGSARRLGRRVSDQPWISEPARLWLFYAGAVAAIPGLDRVPVHSDDRPVFEYLAARSEERQRAAFRLRGWPALWSRVLEAADPVDAAFPGRPLASARAGEALHRASALLLAEEQGGEERASQILRASVPAEWLRVADFSLTEAWPLATGEIRRRR